MCGVHPVGIDWTAEGEPHTLDVKEDWEDSFYGRCRGKMSRERRHVSVAGGHELFEFKTYNKVREEDWTYRGFFLASSYSSSNSSCARTPNGAAAV